MQVQKILLGLCLLLLVGGLFAPTFNPSGGGDASTANPLSQFAATTSAQLAGVISNETGSGLAVFGTAPTIAGGSVTALTSFGVRSTGTGAFDLKLANAENLTVSDKTLTIQLGDTSRTLILGASPSLSGTNTGDQTITLTGDVTGTGTGSFAATIALDAVALATDTTGAYVADLTGGAGITVSGGGAENATITIVTTSSETDFLAVGALTCGAATRGKMQIHTTPLQYCDNAATPALQYAAYGDSAGAALTGDSATSFFSSGEIADAQIVDTITATSYLLLAGGTMTGQIVLDNLALEFEESDTNPACAAGNYNIFADLSEAKFKKCTNGVASDLDTTGGGAALSALTAATGANSINNGDNLQTWNWAKTTNSSGGFLITENTAATGGTTTSGVPNQYLLRLGTIASSTASPLVVYHLGAHVFSVYTGNPGQVGFTKNASGGGAPIITFSTDLDTGIDSDAANQLTLMTNGSVTARLKTTGWTSVATGTASAAAYGWANGEGFYTVSGDEIGIGLSDGVSRGQQYLFSGSLSTLRMTKATVDTVSHIVEYRKARGDLSAPTVITTGDDLGLIEFKGHVGVTNTYQRAAYILGDSTGTISDSATGIGGIIRFAVATVGAEPVEVHSITGAGLTLGTSTVLFMGVTAPTLASGGCTTPTAVTANGTARFSVGVGTSCSGSQPLVFTLPASTTGWACEAQDSSNAATISPAQSSAISTTSVTITAYSRTTGLAVAWTDSDVVVVHCLGG